MCTAEKGIRSLGELQKTWGRIPRHLPRARGKQSVGTRMYRARASVQGSGGRRRSHRPKASGAHPATPGAGDEDSRRHYRRYRRRAFPVPPTPRFLPGGRPGSSFTPTPARARERKRGSCRFKKEDATPAVGVACAGEAVREGGGRVGESERGGEGRGGGRRSWRRRNRIGWAPGRRPCARARRRDKRAPPLIGQRRRPAHEWRRVT